LKQDWEKEAVAKLLATNNAAERPFAVAKAYLHVYGSMKLSNLAKFSLSMCNGSHRLAGPKGKQERTKNRAVEQAGVGMTANDRLKAVVSTLCSVRRAKYGRKITGAKPGSITELLITKYETDKVKEKERRLARDAEEKAKMAKKHLNKSIKFNISVEEPLAKTPEDLELNMQALDNKKGVCLSYLKRQFDARLTRAAAEEYTYDSLPSRYRSAHTTKLVKAPQDKSDHVTYLTDLVLAMMQTDSKRTFRSEISLSGLLRKTPVLESETTNPIATNAKQDMDAYLVSQAEQVDDPWLLLLERDYKGQVCFLDDIAARHKLYRVARISYWASTKYEYANWEATLEPIHLARDGSCFVHDDDCVIGPNGKQITKAKCYRGYIVAQYIAGDDQDPERTECVDDYMSDALAKHYRYESKRPNSSTALSKSSPASPATPLSSQQNNESERRTR
jgi:hypothetical protein